MGIMAGKRGLIMGLANDKSLAWGIAKALAEQGAELAFSYQGPMMEKRVRPLAEALGVARLFECDVSSVESTDACFAALAAEWPTIDFLVHAIGFSDKNELRGRYVDTSLDNFLLTMNVSVYSFTAVAQRAATMMPDGGAMLTLSYYGAEKVIPHYNVMGVAKAALEASVRYLACDLGPRGVRVNAISPGEIDTSILSPGTEKIVQEQIPMRRLGRPEEVAQAIYFLCTEASSYVNGAEIHINGGQHV